jgi:sugar lactone lactonase YvrE
MKFVIFEPNPVLIPLLSLALVFPVSARPKTFDVAVSVLGQANFTAEVENDPPTSRSLYQVDGLAIDPTTGKLFVSDSGNHRILRFSSSAAYRTSSVAEAVIGQADFVSGLANRGGTPTGDSLSSPANLCFDAEGNLWVADFGNARVLRFDGASSDEEFGAFADGVIGQPDFTSEETAMNDVSDSGFINPAGVAIDSGGSLFVSESGGIPRILRFDNAKLITTSATRPDANGYLGSVVVDAFISGTSDSSLSSYIYGLHIDFSGNLWVADASNNRVLRFDSAAEKLNGASADGFFGQPDFNSNSLIDPPTAASMNFPGNVTVAPDGTAWVSDYSNHRVLGFLDAANQVGAAAADIVLGVPDFVFIDPAPTTTARSTAFPTQVAIGREGSLFVGDYSNGAHIKRFSDPVTLKAPKSITAKGSRATIRGTSSGSLNVLYKIPKQGGFKKAAGSAKRWKIKARDLTKKVTRITVQAVAFDGRVSQSKVKVLKE